MAASLRIVFFGTPEIAVPTLERLVAGPHEVVGVVSQPDRPRGRGRKESPSPVSELALREKLPLLRPERVGDDEIVDALRNLRPDLGVVVAFGQFLPKKVRTLPSLGYLINAHASLLPSHRGASPIAQAILDGDPETGVSVMRIEREMDAGPVGLVERTPIGAMENTEELSQRLAQLAARAIARAVDSIARGELDWTEQDASRATLAPKLEKSDATLDLRESARRVAARIHALSPKPGGALLLVSGSAPGSDDTVAVALKVLRAETRDFADDTADGAAGSNKPAPGTITRNDDGLLRIATGDGWLVPLALQRAGGKPLATADFLRGFELPKNARFALPEDAGSEMSS
jgi:methionyl-tRNA formyltransferase